MSNIFEVHAALIKAHTSKLDQCGRLALAGFGLAGEFVEAVEAPDTEVVMELGDFLWYAHLFCIETGTSFPYMLGKSEHAWAISSKAEDAYPHLCHISEFMKKVTVTKKKSLEEVRLPLIEHLSKAVNAAMGLVPIGTTAEDIVSLNIRKLEQRFGEKWL